MWRINDPQGAEALKIKYEIVPYTRGRGLDLGCGMWKCYEHFIGVDSLKQWGSLSPADKYALNLNRVFVSSFGTYRRCGSRVKGMVAGY